MDIIVVFDVFGFELLVDSFIMIILKKKVKRMLIFIYLLSFEDVYMCSIFYFWIIIFIF